jgi:hypothetical protein
MRKKNIKWKDRRKTRGKRRRKMSRIWKRKWGTGRDHKQEESWEENKKRKAKLFLIVCGPEVISRMSLLPGNFQQLAPSASPKFGRWFAASQSIRPQQRVYFTSCLSLVPVTAEVTMNRKEPSFSTYVTGYGLDERGSIPSRNSIYLFTTRFRPAPGTTQPPIQWVPGPLPSGVRRSKREADHSPPPPI